MEKQILVEKDVPILRDKILQKTPKYSGAELSYCLNLVEGGDYIYLDQATQTRCQIVVAHHRANEAVYLDVVWITTLIALSALYVAVRALYKVFGKTFKS